MSLSISQLSQTFDRQRLGSYDADAVVQDSWATSPSFWPQLTEEPCYVTDSQPPSPTSRSPRCVNRRLQRQRDVRALCDPAHLRSISELVERMIDNGDQCGVSQAKVTIPVASTPGPIEEPDSYDSSEDSSPPRNASMSSSLGRRSNSSASENSNPTSPRAAGFCKDYRVQKNRKSTGRERR